LFTQRGCDGVAIRRENVMVAKSLDPASVSFASLLFMRSSETAKAFALVDGALLRNLSASTRKKWASLAKHSLLGQAAIGAVDVGPLLFELTQAHVEAHLPTSLLELNSGRCAGSVIVTEADTTQLVKHLTSLIDVRLNDGSEMVMRYFDPRVFPFWLEVLKPSYREHLAFVVSQWMFWDAKFELKIESFAPPKQQEIPPNLPMTLSSEQEARLMNLTYPFTMIERFRSEDQGALDRIPVPHRYTFFKMQIARANSHGLESQGEVEAYCGTAIDIGPKFDEDAAMTPAWLGIKAGKPYHEAIAGVADADWQRMRGVQ
jgi:hypothetical protein